MKETASDEKELVKSGLMGPIMVAAEPMISAAQPIVLDKQKINGGAGGNMELMLRELGLFPHICYFIGGNIR